MSLRTVHGFTVPSVHLNGTGATTLREEYAAAYDALRKAREAFASTTSNARDFYLQGDYAYQNHRNERCNALADLDRVINYVGSILEGICDQQ